jgi:hypothetical protein
MLPNGFEQLELFETSPTGELIPAFDFDYSDYCGEKNKTEKKDKKRSEEFLGELISDDSDYSEQRG